MPQYDPLKSLRALVAVSSDQGKGLSCPARHGQHWMAVLPMPRILPSSPDSGKRRAAGEALAEWSAAEVRKGSCGEVIQAAERHAPGELLWERTSELASARFEGDEASLRLRQVVGGGGYPRPMDCSGRGATWAAVLWTGGQVSIGDTMSEPGDSGSSPQLQGHARTVRLGSVGAGLGKLVS